MGKALRNISQNNLKTMRPTQSPAGPSRVQDGYLLALQPLLQLHPELLGGVGPGPHHVGPRVHSLESKVALLVHLIHHRVKRW